MFTIRRLESYLYGNKQSSLTKSNARFTRGFVVYLGEANLRNKSGKSICA
jgi:hypothetical protein